MTRQLWDWEGCREISRIKKERKKKVYIPEDTTRHSRMTLVDYLLFLTSVTFYFPRERFIMASDIIIIIIIIMIIITDHHNKHIFQDNYALRFKDHESETQKY